jgi:hypothetical protein
MNGGKMHLFYVGYRPPLCSYKIETLQLFVFSCHKQSCVMNHASKMFLIQSKNDTKASHHYKIPSFLLAVGDRIVPAAAEVHPLRLDL